MLRMFTWRTAAVMTEVTHQRCALELATDMTTRAIQEFVSTEQWEAGGEVIEALAMFFGLNRGHKHKQCCNQDELERGKKVVSDDVFLETHLLVPKRLISTSLKFLVLWQLPHCPPNNLS